MRGGSAVFLATLACAVPATAWPCGATPPAFWVLGQVHPGDGALDLPIDGVVVIEGRAITDIYPGDRSGNELAQVLQVRVVERETRKEVPGHLDGWIGTKPAAAVWRPAAPLSENTTYELDAVVVNSAPSLPEARTGPLALKSAFRTGSERLRPIALTSALVARGETHDEPVYPPRCHAPCGGPPSCGPSGTMRVARLKLTVPALAGGADALGYQVWAWLVRGEPGSPEHDEDVARFRSRGTHHGFGIVDGRVGGTLLVGDTFEGQLRRCLYTRIYDATGNAFEPAPACTEAAKESDPPGERTTVQAPTGCSFASARAGGGGALFLVVIAALVSGRRRARAALAVALMGLACASGSSPVDQRPREDVLDDTAFSAPWVLIDRVASGNLIQSVAQGPAGYVAITYPPNLSGGKIVAIADGIARSPDGVSWSEGKIQPMAHYNSIAYGEGRFVAVGGQSPGGGAGLVAASRDGEEWAIVHQAPTVLRRVRQTGRGFVAVGMNGTIVVSADGISWHSTQAPGAGSLWDAGYTGGRFVAVGDIMVTSMDGLTWARTECGPSLPCARVTDPSGGVHDILSLNDLAAANGVFVASGAAGLLRSTDGVVWTREADGIADPVSAGGDFISLARPRDADQDSFDVSHSTDGRSWAVRGTADRRRTDLTCAQVRCLVLSSALALVPGRAAATPASPSK